MEFIEYSLESLRDESICLAEMVEGDGYRPDCVAYLARGGWVIGEAVAGHFGAPLIELSAHRSGDAAKERGASLLARLPKVAKKTLREWEIRRRLSTDSGEAQRKSVRLTERYQVPSSAERVLLVDDSADTGASISAAMEQIERLFPGSDVRVAVINSFAPARDAVRLDWSLHIDCLLCTPMSKDSRDYLRVCREYESGGREHVSRVRRDSK